MEDQWGLGHLNGNPLALYLAVFDGHGSDACAKFCSSIFPKHVSQRIEIVLTILFLNIINLRSSKKRRKISHIL